MLWRAFWFCAILSLCLAGAMLLPFFGFDIVSLCDLGLFFEVMSGPGEGFSYATANRMDFRFASGTKMSQVPSVVDPAIGNSPFYGVSRLGGNVFMMNPLGHSAARVRYAVGAPSVKSWLISAYVLTTESEAYRRFIESLLLNNKSLTSLYTVSSLRKLLPQYSTSIARSNVLRHPLRYRRRPSLRSRGTFLLFGKRYKALFMAGPLWKWYPRLGDGLPVYQGLTVRDTPLSFLRGPVIRRYFEGRLTWSERWYISDDNLMRLYAFLLRTLPCSLSVHGPIWDTFVYPLSSQWNFTLHWIERGSSYPKSARVQVDSFQSLRTFIAFLEFFGGRLDWFNVRLDNLPSRHITRRPVLPAHFEYKARAGAVPTKNKAPLPDLPGMHALMGHFWDKRLFGENFTEVLHYPRCRNRPVFSLEQLFDRHTRGVPEVVNRSFLFNFKTGRGVNLKKLTLGPTPLEGGLLHFLFLYGVGNMLSVHVDRELGCDVNLDLSDLIDLLFKELSPLEKKAFVHHLDITMLRQARSVPIRKHWPSAYRNGTLYKMYDEVDALENLVATRFFGMPSFANYLGSRCFNRQFWNLGALYSGGDFLVGERGGFYDRAVTTRQQAAGKAIAPSPHLQLFRADVFYPDYLIKDKSPFKRTPARRRLVHKKNGQYINADWDFYFVTRSILGYHALCGYNKLGLLVHSAGLRSSKLSGWFIRPFGYFYNRAFELELRSGLFPKELVAKAEFQLFRDKLLLEAQLKFWTLLLQLQDGKVPRLQSAELTVPQLERGVDNKQHSSLFCYPWLVIAVWWFTKVWLMSVSVSSATLYWVFNLF